MVRLSIVKMNYFSKYYKNIKLTSCGNIVNSYYIKKEITIT